MKVKFLPQNKVLEIKPNQSILNLAQENDIHIQSVCKGLPSCAECRVNVVEGHENLLPPMENELDLIGTAYFVDNRRLSCQMRCFGDVVVDLTEQVEKENESSKQPQGRAVKKEGESFARMGNILEEPGDKAEGTESKDEDGASHQSDESLEVKSFEQRQNKTGKVFKAEPFKNEEKNHGQGSGKKSKNKNNSRRNSKRRRPRSKQNNDNNKA